MSQDADQFFEEEGELARKQAAPAPSKAQPARAEKTPAAKAPAKEGAKPPSFAMVVVIALAALLLGVCIGYFFAMLVVDRGSAADTLSVTTEQVVVSASDESSAAVSSMGSEMPEGHPDISSMMNADGTVNQEAVDAYKAQVAQEKEADGATDAASE